MKIGKFENFSYYLVFLFCFIESNMLILLKIWELKWYFFFVFILEGYLLCEVIFRKWWRCFGRFCVCYFCRVFMDLLILFFRKRNFWEYWWVIFRRRVVWEIIWLIKSFKVLNMIFWIKLKWFFCLLLIMIMEIFIL